MDDKFTIIRDTREKVNHGWSYDPDAYCNGTLIKTVHIGDYTVEGLENYVAIERKESIDEFARNCVEKRWKMCMHRMAACKHKYILFEFSWDDINNYPKSSKVPNRMRGKLRVPAKYIRKVINTARYDHKIHVIPCGNKYTAEKVAYRILKKAYELRRRTS